MAVRALLENVLVSETQCSASITYFDEETGFKVEITDRVPAPGDLATVQAIARSRAESFTRNAEALERLRASVGQEIDLTPPEARPPNDAAIAGGVFLAAVAEVDRCQRNIPRGLDTEEDLARAKETLKALNKPEYRPLT